ncbi:hypothetical protein MHM88_11380 [Epibacterium sp. MM17-32]|uniref:hypothetical protein n=1 Tax=Epibacterium sp. MM17-32 TaxID=2917734 RepID=UPI001EF59065|nr:hypothetical protein [Epibacterium sp. MM17-32]MCG7628409.1 hypothetical protein [Epibacterium sp. MM17-32]
MDLEMSFGTAHADVYTEDGELWVELSDEKTSDPYYNKHVKVSDLRELIAAVEDTGSRKGEG